MAVRFVKVWKYVRGVTNPKECFLGLLLGKRRGVCFTIYNNEFVFHWFKVFVEEAQRCLSDWKRNKNSLVKKSPKLKVDVVFVCVALVPSLCGPAQGSLLRNPKIQLAETRQETTLKICFPQAKFIHSEIKKR